MRTRTCTHTGARHALDLAGGPLVFFLGLEGAGLLELREKRLGGEESCGSGFHAPHPPAFPTLWSYFGEFQSHLGTWSFWPGLSPSPSLDP